jgi:membrane protein DedA with SNARE-associated domain/rhodanese-related sulfurtransferase
MTTQLLPLLAHYGVLIVFIAVLIDQIGLPVPASPVLILAGTLAAQGKLFAPELLGVSVVACMIADWIWFWIGKTYGMRVLKTMCRISLEPDSCVSQTQNSFERWGANSLVVAKFIPGLALIAPPLAGALRVTWRRFIVLSACGSVLWAALGLGMGMVFSAQIERLLSELDRIGGLAIALMGALLAGYVVFKWWQRRRFMAQLRMARISVDELYRDMQAGHEPVIVDVRSHVARKLEPRWIPSAIHAPIEDIQHSVRELPRGRELVVYCACPNEASAARVAKLLMNQGFTRVRPLLGGLDAWIEAGYEIEVAPTVVRGNGDRSPAPDP